jgi:L-2-hydroxyglutarate oxidase LhgO
VKQFDFIVVGAGIVGLTCARELARRKMGRILVLEKEPKVGMHASGRNSGVVHAGIYYSADSLKAKFCVDGHRRLIDYVEESKLPILKCGKVIVATREENQPVLDTLWDRAAKNGVKVQKLSLEDLREIEPEARSFGWAIWSPNTAVIDSKTVLHRLEEELTSMGVTIAHNEEVQAIDTVNREVKTKSNSWQYGFLVNAAGVYADRIAEPFGVGLNYRILPFKGLYWKAHPTFTAKIKGLIYPVPDIRMPFLGVHITKTIKGEVTFGPTAIPAFGRENYSLFGGMDLLETPKIAAHLLGLLIKNPSNFRSYVREELGRYVPSRFYAECKTLVHHMERQDIGEFYKVGIRPQLMDVKKKQLEMDFVIEQGRNSIHILNAISPAFTCALSFAPFVVDRIDATDKLAGAPAPTPVLPSPR